MTAAAAGDATPHGRRPTSTHDFFAEPSDQPRVRRSADAALAIAGGALLVILAIVARGGTAVDQAWVTFVVHLPAWLVWLGQAAYLVSIAAACGLLIGIAIWARRRLELLLDLVLAALLAVVAAGALSRWVDGRWPAVALTDLDHTRTTYPAFVITAIVAVQAAAAPHLSAPVRRVGWGIALGGAAGAILGGIYQLNDVAGAILVGLVAAAVIRFVFGTSAGVPSLARVRAALSDLGVGLSEIAYHDVQPANSTLLDGTMDNGVSVYVRVLDRDSWRNSRWARAWQSAWYQDTGAQYGSTRRQQVEHEALAGVLAAKAGVDVLDLVAVGQTASDDAVVVVACKPKRLVDLDPGEVDDNLLDHVWTEVAQLHAAGLSHGRLDSSRIWVEHDQPALGDFSGARISATESSRRSDVAELLVATTLIVGPDRAISSARRTIGDDALADSLSLLQPAALTPQTKRDAHRARLKVDSLRKQTATALGVQPPELEKLQRVSLVHIGLMAISIVAIYGIISQLADLGFSTITHALSHATWGLVIVALILVQLTNVTDAFSLASASPKPIPVGVTSVEQIAIGFVNLAVPSSAGSMALNIRFFQRFGVNAVTSSTTATIVSAMAFVDQALLLLLTIVVGKQSIDLSNLDTSGSGVSSLLILVVVIVVGGVALVFAVPRWRHWVKAKLQGPMQDIKGALRVLKNPKNLLCVVGGQLGSQVLYASGLLLCVVALGGSVNLGQVLFINISVSLLSGILPVPGGIGVVEGGLTAGLTAVGVSSDIALPAVILYRLCSYYLPPIWGWACLQWLTRNDYL